MKKRFIVTVAMITAAFSISACGNTQASEINSVEYDSGSYKIGKDIPAGEYNLESTEPGIFGSNVTVKSSSKVDELCIEMLEFFEGTYSVTVKDGQYIELDGCKIVE